MNCISCESWWRIAYQNNIYRFLFIMWYEWWYSGAKYLKGGMGGNFEVLCRRGHTILLASDTMRLIDPSRKLCRPRGETWLAIFPHAWEEIWQWFVVNSALRFARVWSHDSQIDLCTPGDFAQLYSCPNACFINLSLQCYGHV
jgi:hypothetical protein